MNFSRNFWKAASCLMMAAVVLGSCEKKAAPDKRVDYLPAQMSKGGAWSIIDKNGKEVVKEEYPAEATLSHVSSDGAYWVKQNGKYYLYNLADPKKPIMEEKFSHATQFSAGVAVVSKPNEQIRIIDTKGNTVATLGKDIKRCRELSEDGYAKYESTDGNEGIINSKGNIVVKPIYSFLIAPDEGLFLAQKGDDTYHIVNMKSEQVGKIDPEKYNIWTSIHEGKILVRDADDDEGHIIALDSKGQKLFSIKKAKKLNPWNDDYYNGGYLTFQDDNGKYGVANAKGEVVIRPRYELLYNFGNGLFAAMIGEKAGVVNEKGETIINFKYDDFCSVMLGDNFIFWSGGSLLLIGKNGKELTSFDNASAGFAWNYAEYIDVTGITNSIIKFFGEMEQLQTADKTAKALELDIDLNHYQSHISRSLNIDDKVKGDYCIWFDDRIAEEKTHQQQINDGWFTYTQTISDGWQWTQAMPRRVKGELDIESSAISADDLYLQLCQQLAHEHMKISEGTYSKNVTIDGKMLECRTQLTLDGQQIDYEITFIK